MWITSVFVVRGSAVTHLRLHSHKQGYDFGDIWLDHFRGCDKVLSVAKQPSSQFLMSAHMQECSWSARFDLISLSTETQEWLEESESEDDEEEGQSKGAEGEGEEDESEEESDDEKGKGSFCPFIVLAFFFLSTFHEAYNKQQARYTTDFYRLMTIKNR